MIFTLATRRAIFAAIALIPFALSAQILTEDPKNPGAAGFSTLYKSVFSDYKSYQDPEIQVWKKSNADVSQFGPMKASSMGDMKGIPDKSMGNMKARNPTLTDKKPASPANQLSPSMLGHDGMQSR